MLTSYDPSLFLKSPPESALCAICQDVMGLPVALGCGHSFCKGCLAGKVTCCPYCRAKIPGGTASLSINFSLKDIIESFEIRCPNHVLGCTDVATLASLDRHKCGFVPDVCAHAGCPYSVLKSKHRLLRSDKLSHEQECVWRPVRCSNDRCNVTLPFRDFDLHKGTCEFKPIDCALCGEQLIATALPAHGRVCPAATVRCAVNGCEFTAVRGDQDAWGQHMAQSAAYHVVLLQLALSQEQRTCSELRYRVLLLESKLASSGAGQLPCVRWIVSNFAAHRAANAQLFSPEFCFHQAINPKHRYSFTLWCYPNGVEDSGDLAIYFTPRCGPTPEDLEWPMTSAIELCVRNRDQGKDKRYTLQPVDDLKHRMFFMQHAPPRQDNTSGRGWHSFLTRGEVLGGGVVKGDCLVVEAALKCSCCTLP